MNVHNQWPTELHVLSLSALVGSVSVGGVLVSSVSKLYGNPVIFLLHREGCRSELPRETGQGSALPTQLCPVLTHKQTNSETHQTFSWEQRKKTKLFKDCSHHSTTAEPRKRPWFRRVLHILKYMVQKTGFSADYDCSKRKSPCAGNSMLESKTESNFCDRDNEKR